MSLINNNCVEFHDTRPECKADHNGKKYVLNNKSGFKVRKVKIELCLKNVKEGDRCDYLFSIDKQNNNLVFFVELKGGDLVKAVNQIIHTIHLLRNEFMGYRIEARIVGTRNVPGLTSFPAYRKLAGLIKPNGKIKVRTNRFYSENI